jgi:hypothetical protein
MTMSNTSNYARPASMTSASVGDRFVSLTAQYNGREISSSAECDSPKEGMEKALCKLPLGENVQATVYPPTRSKNGMTRVKVMLECDGTAYPGFGKHSDESMAIGEAGLGAILNAISPGNYPFQCTA